MHYDPNEDDKFAQLRNRAEDILERQDAEITPQVWNDVEKLIHEYQVHKVELEVQNQDLREAQQKLLSSQQQLRDLFDFAPVAYLILNQDGHIERANISASDMLGQDVESLKGEALSNFVQHDDRDIFYLHRRNLVRQDTPQIDELRITNGEHIIYVQMHSVLIGSTRRMRVMLTDITSRRLGEMRLQQLHDLGRAILHAQKPREIIETALHQVMHMTTVDIAMICLIDEHHKSTYSIQRGQKMWHDVRRGDYTDVLQLLANEDDKTLKASQILEVPDLSSFNYRFVTIKHQDEPRGFVALGYENGHLSDQVMSIAREVAVQVGISTYQAELLEATQQEAIQLEERVEQQTQTIRQREQDIRILADNMQDIVALHDHAGNCNYMSPSIRQQLGWSPEQVRNAGILSLIHPGDRNDVVRAPSHILGERHRLRLRHKDGHYLWFESNGKLIEGDFAGSVTSFRNIHSQVLAEEAQKDQQAFTQALIRIANELTRTLNLDQVESAVMQALHQIIPFDGANIMLIDHDEYTSRVAHLRGYDDADLENWLSQKVFHLAGTPGEQMLDTQQPVLAADIPNMPDWKISPETAKIKSYVGAPIIAEQKVLGFLNLDSYTANFYTSAHAERLQQFAKQAAVAIHNAQLHLQSQELAIIEERQRIARELHDAVSQSLFAASTLSESLLQLTDDEQIHQHLHELHRAIVSSQAEMRTLLLELRPASIEDTPLTLLLAQLITSLKTRREIEVNLQLIDVDSISIETKVLLFRTIQEGLTNVLKHANATQVDILLTQPHEHYLHLVIRDNGEGFDPNQDKVGHYGLRGMRERARLNNANLAINSQQTEGTEIVLTVPL